MDDIKECRFLNIDDFYRRRKHIRKYYSTLDETTKEVYKWYFFYQICIIKEPLRTLAWEYTNNYRDVDEFLIQAYDDFCEKRNKLINRNKFDNN